MVKNLLTNLWRVFQFQKKFVEQSVQDLLKKICLKFLKKSCNLWKKKELQINCWTFVFEREKIREQIDEGLFLTVLEINFRWTRCWNIWRFFFYWMFRKKPGYCRIFQTNLCRNCWINILSNFCRNLNISTTEMIAEVSQRGSFCTIRTLRFMKIHVVLYTYT